MRKFVAEFINCTVVSEETVSCNGSVYNLPEKRLTYHDEEFWIYIGIYTALVMTAGECMSSVFVCLYFFFFFFPVSVLLDVDMCLQGARTISWLVQIFKDPHNLPPPAACTHLVILSNHVTMAPDHVGRKIHQKSHPQKSLEHVWCRKTASPSSAVSLEGT